MKIGIIETGAPPGNLEASFGRFDAMLRSLLGECYQYKTYTAYLGVLPGEVEEQDAYIITGSLAGVHDGVKWIDNLVTFLRAARGRRKLIGICFGHQIMAHAFGGEVGRALSGWAIGRQSYQVFEVAYGLAPADVISATVFHQDQVVSTPDGTRIVAGNELTPYAVLAYENHSAISFQCHPEFSDEFARALVEEAAAAAVTASEHAAAIRSFDQATGVDPYSSVISRFLKAEIG